MVTTLGGTLRRIERDRWEWSDGTPEPRVQDLSGSSHYNFRVQGGFVEVPARLAMEEDALIWVLTGHAEGRFQRALSGDHRGPLVIDTDGAGRAHIHPGTGEPLPGNIPRVILVPRAEWDAWSASKPLGATWDKADEPQILAKARSLGWSDE